jgi:CRISPR system Cascade subunit CasD
MIDVLLLRLAAPLMSFGDVAVDARGPTRLFPTRSMLAGLCANALGYTHHEPARTQALQTALRFASRRDRAGEPLRDYQTVDLGQRDARGVAWMGDTGWTTRGAREDRGGGTAGDGTHIRERFYLADALYTVALTLAPASDAAPDAPPTLDQLAVALTEPARPLFLGRKPCLPSAPLLLGRVQAPSLLEALAGVPLPRHGAAADGYLLAEWPDDAAEAGAAAVLAPASRRLAITDERDWTNQIHVGRRFVREGLLRVGVADAGRA